ncbi:MAG: RimK family protein [Pseudomonadota bacterium]
MRKILVVERNHVITQNLSGVEVVYAQDYLNKKEYQRSRQFRVFNLCDSYQYQAIGYYVSLLALARGHRVTPNVLEIEALKSRMIWRLRSDDLDELIQKSLKDIKSTVFDLSIYFGKNIAKKYDVLSAELSRIFSAPLIRAHFVFEKKWKISSLRPIGLGHVAESHNETVRQFAHDYFKKNERKPKLKSFSSSLAILINPADPMPPSNPKALKKIIAAGAKYGIECECITKKDLHRLGEFDGLFIRETTQVNHHTFRFAQKARELDIPVIDDPEAIIRLTNKVYLAELFQKHKVPSPETIILFKTAYKEQLKKLVYPQIIKQPDSAFSHGVIKVTSEEDAHTKIEKLFDDSELLIAQVFMPTAYDWRVTVLENKPLFVCQYFMVTNSWKIYEHTADKSVEAGEFKTWDIADVPEGLLELACSTSRLIGDGLYGLDIKEINGQFHVIEINDNPNIDAGIEDQIAGDQLYETIIQYFFKRMNRETKSINGNAPAA